MNGDSGRRRPPGRVQQAHLAPALRTLAVDDPRAVALHYETCTRQLLEHAAAVAAAWLELLSLLEQRGVLVVGDVPPAAVLGMDEAIRALLTGPGE